MRSARDDSIMFADNAVFRRVEFANDAIDVQESATLRRHCCELLTMRSTRYTSRRGRTLIFSLSTWVDDDEWLKRYIRYADDDATSGKFSDNDDESSQDDRNLRRLVGFVHRDRNDVNATTAKKKKKRRKLLDGSESSFNDTVREQLVYYSDLPKKQRRAAAVIVSERTKSTDTTRLVTGHEDEDNDSFEFFPGSEHDVVVDKRSLAFPRRRRQIKLRDPLLSTRAYLRLFERVSPVVRFVTIRSIRWIEEIATRQYSDILFTRK